MSKFKTLIFLHSLSKKGLLFSALILIYLNSYCQDIFISDSIARFVNSGSPNQAIKNIQFAQLHFTKACNRRIDIGLVGNIYHYFLLKVNSKDTLVQIEYLCIDNTSLDFVSIYKMNLTAAPELLYLGGDKVPFDDKRNYVWHTAQLNISKSASFYLIAMKAAHKNLNLRYDILKAGALQKKYIVYQRYVFFYLGGISMVALAILIVWILFRKIVFGAYLGYIICTAGWILTHYGFIYPMVYAQWPVINEIIKPVTSLGASLFLMLVLLLVFQNRAAHKQHLMRVLKIAIYIIATLISLMFFLLIPTLNGNIKGALIALWQIGLIFSIIIIILTPLILIKSGFTAKILAAAVLIISAMTIIQQIANLGYIKSFFINEHGIALASLLEISVMTFGLLYNFYQDKKEKERKIGELEKEQAITFKKLITVQDNERKRIAADLHDNIGPLLAALKINFKRIITAKEKDLQDELIGKTESIIDDSIGEIRNVAHNLMPKGLSANGLINTLDDYFGSIQQLYSRKVQFDHQIHSIINPDLQINLYRIICELVLNAAKYSCANLISIQITSNEKLISLTICDDGNGFVQKPGGKNSLGLQNEENRVLYLRGKFSLKTCPGEGTIIYIEIPL